MAYGVATKDGRRRRGLPRAIPERRDRGQVGAELPGVRYRAFEFAIRERWAHHNPGKEVERPDLAEDDPEIRFLDKEELDALLRATAAGRSKHTPKTIQRASRVRVMREIEKRSWKQIAGAIGVADSTAIYLYQCDPEAALEDDLARVERVLYLTASMSGLRQGELLALRWMDIDWTAQRIRVRRNYVRGQFGSPKSTRSSRSVPLADEVAAELERPLQTSAFQTDEELVFGHPHTGRPMSRSQPLKRFKRTATGEKLNTNVMPASRAESSEGPRGIRREAVRHSDATCGRSSWRYHSAARQTASRTATSGSYPSSRRAPSIELRSSPPNSFTPCHCPTLASRLGCRSSQ